MVCSGDGDYGDVDDCEMIMILVMMMRITVTMMIAMAMAMIASMTTMSLTAIRLSVIYMWLKYVACDVAFKMSKLYDTCVSIQGYATHHDYFESTVMPNCVAYQEEPFVRVIDVVTSNGNPPIGPFHYEGYCVDLLDMIAKRVNFQYTLHVQDLYGAIHANGTWDGMVGELVRKVSHISPTASPTVIF